MVEEAEQNLIVRAVAGDQDALGALLQQFAPDVRRQLQIESHLLSRFDLDDVMQVTFLEAFLDIRRFDPNHHGTFPGWLLHIARNNLRDLIKEAARAKRPPPARCVRSVLREESYLTLIDALSGTGETPSQHMAAREVRHALDGAIAKLPDIYRDVVRAVDLQERSAAEVGETLGRSPGAIHMLRARAHDRLRTILGSESRFFGRRA